VGQSSFLSRKARKTFATPLIACPLKASLASDTLQSASTARPPDIAQKSALDGRIYLLENWNDTTTG
jgi:hypothetical protein